MTCQILDVIYKHELIIHDFDMKHCQKDLLVVSVVQSLSCSVARSMRQNGSTADPSTPTRSTSKAIAINTANVSVNVNRTVMSVTCSVANNNHEVNFVSANA